MPPGGRRQPRLRDHGRPPPGGRAGAAARQAGTPSSPMTATCRRRRARQARRDLAADRAQHGRQVDLPAPERADRDPGADGLLRAGARRPYRRRRPAVLPRRRLRRSGARALDLHGRDGRDGGDPQPGGRARLVILDEIGRGTATFDGLSIAWAAVEYLHEKNRCRAIFATHFHEMTALAGKLAAPAQRHHAGQGMGGRRGLPARGGQGCGRPLLWRPGGAARRPARTPWWSARGPCCTSWRPAKSRARPTAWSTTCRCSPSPPSAISATAPPRRRPTRSATALDALNPDEMTPREALEALYRLKGM